MAYRFDFYVQGTEAGNEGVSRAIILLINVFELLVLIFFFRDFHDKKRRIESARTCSHSYQKCNF